MLAIFVVFLTRLLLVVLFLPFSALDKILNFKQATAQAEQAVPGYFAVLLLLAGFGVEVVMSLAILTGIADRAASLVLACYCIITALLWKQFWKAPDFRLRGTSRGRETFWDFLKNLGLAGGFLLLAFGTNQASVQRFLAHPSASSHPYATIDQGGA